MCLNHQKAREINFQLVQNFFKLCFGLIFLQSSLFLNINWSTVGGVLTILLSLSTLSDIFGPVFSFKLISEWTKIWFAYFYSCKAWHWESFPGREEISLASEWGSNGNGKVGWGNQKVCCGCCETRGNDQSWTPEINVLRSVEIQLGHAYKELLDISFIALTQCNPCNLITSI